MSLSYDERPGPAHGIRCDRPEPAVDGARRDQDVDAFLSKKPPNGRQGIQIQIVLERKFHGPDRFRGFSRERGPGAGTQDISMPSGLKTSGLGNMVALLAPEAGRAIEVENAKLLLQFASFVV